MPAKDKCKAWATGPADACCGAEHDSMLVVPQAIGSQGLCNSAGQRLNVGATALASSQM